MKANLIALVVVSCMVDGVRTEVQPGETLPELSPHDVAELKRMGSIEDQDEKAAAAKQETRDDAAAGRDFAKEKKAVIAANASKGDSSSKAAAGK